VGKNVDSKKICSLGREEMKKKEDYALILGNVGVL
jgi:hypothetical protein